LGTCAGVILLARRVTNPAQRSLGFLDVSVERNGYGRQIDSFEAIGNWSDGSPLEMVFIRAPRIVQVGTNVEVLARFGADPVLVRQDRIIGATFHPEITSDPSVHRRFLDTCDDG
jgi:5'-phosphate synthase pdxT subunit